MGIALACLTSPLGEAAASSTQTSEIKIKVTPPNLSEDQFSAQVLGFGLPLVRGMVQEDALDKFRLSCSAAANLEGGTVNVEPVDLAVMQKAVWANPEEQNGTSNLDVRWAWVEYRWSPDKPECTLRLNGDGESHTASPNMPVTTDSEGVITVSNGVYAVQLSPDSLFPSQISRDSSELLTTNASSNFYLKDKLICDEIGGSDCRFHPTNAVNWTVERNSQFRTVIKGEGYYPVQGNEDAEVAKAVVRYTFLKDTPYLDIEHQLIGTREKVQFTELGLEMRPIDGVDVWAITEEQAAKSLEGSSSTPGSFNEDQSQYSLKFWEPTEQLAYIDYSPITIFNSFSDTYKNSVASQTGTDVNSVAADLDVLSNAWGVGRTHKVRLVLSKDNPIENMHVLAQTLVEPYLARVDETYITNLDNAVFPVMSYKGEGGNNTLDEGWDYDDHPPTYAELENLHSMWFDDYLERGSWSPLEGWYNYGRAPFFRYMKENVDNQVNVYPQWYRQSISQYNIVHNSIYSWARSGDRKYIDFARKANRFSRDFSFAHDGGNSWKCVLGENEVEFSGATCARKYPGQYVSGYDSKFPFYWIKAGVFTPQQVNDGEDVTALSLDYFLFDDLASLDVIKAYKNAVVAGFYAYDEEEDRLEKLETIKTKIFGTTPFPSMAAMLAIYKVTEDETIGKWLADILPLFFDQDGELALDNDYWTINATNTYLSATYKLDRKLSAFLNIYNYLKADRYPDLDLEFVLEEMTQIHSFLVERKAYDAGAAPSQSMAPLFYREAYKKTCDSETFENLQWNLETAVMLHRNALKYREDNNHTFKGTLPDIPEDHNTANFIEFTSPYFEQNFDHVHVDGKLNHLQYHIEPSRNTYMLYALPIGMKALLQGSEACYTGVKTDESS
ncbi:hypothetical protein [Flexibacterium corallicola]|uniref:hypothetical protein n=1 Tax=Flexibacterium corallicola TaxID=3037259 RepID=UPI00286EE05B|nr:hypothetical protein [Pseudovibrio sp. M1P-2-3]